jgi:HAD superfamily hydrolase (TIGR01509 family)
MRNPEVLLFDLGGVLLDYAGVESLHALIKGRHTLAEIRRLWPDSPSLSRVERGESTLEEFAPAFVAEWGLAIDPVAFLSEFRTWTRGPYDGALDLLAGLGENFRLACLTNMNAAYWHRIRDDMGLGRHFDRCFASHEIGLLKPDRRIYEHVVAQLESRPEAIAFFDDTVKNVEAARNFGFDAHHVEGLEALKEKLRDLGVIERRAG